jgi:hypothetical protein
MVADSRMVALNHTAGPSLPQQIQMALFFQLSYTKPKTKVVPETNTQYENNQDPTVPCLGDSVCPGRLGAAPD